MQIDFLTNNLSTPTTLIPQIINEWRKVYEAKAFEQYNPQLHKVNSKIYRPKKEIRKPNGIIDANGQEGVTTTWVDVNRISLALQKLIVSTKTSFVTGGEVNLKAKPANAKEQELYDYLNTTWRKNKLQYKNAELFKRLASETEVAEIWYSEMSTGVPVMKVNIISPSMGYDLIPVFDRSQDLIAFGKKYTDASVNYLDLYTADKISHYVQKQGQAWELDYETPLPYGKIPVVYVRGIICC